MIRHLRSLFDVSSSEIQDIFIETAKMKKNPRADKGLLADKHIGLIFQKPSNRTRVSFEVGISQLGGRAIYLSPGEINLGVREAVPDVAKTLSRYLDGIVVRVFRQSDVEELAKYGSIPVVNALSDMYHPCQALTDIFSIKEHFGALKGLTLGYIGDGNNVGHSLIIAAAKVGMNVRMATPKGYEPDLEIVSQAREFAKENDSEIALSNSPEEAAKGAQILYTDVWVSMGEEAQLERRLKDFKNFQVNKELADLADKNYIFMHCLPAHRGQEVSADVMDDPTHSIVFDQAENRLHTQKAILKFLFVNK